MHIYFTTFTANFKNLSRLSNRDLMIQGSFDNTDMKWKDDIKNILPFYCVSPWKRNSNEYRTLSLSKETPFIRKLCHASP